MRLRRVSKRTRAWAISNSLGRKCKTHNFYMANLEASRAAKPPARSFSISIPSGCRLPGHTADLVAVHLGHVRWSDVAGKALTIEGDSRLAKKLPIWLRLDNVVGQDFPVVRPA